MTPEDIDVLFERVQLKKTKLRTSLLEIFFENHQVLSQKDILNLLKGKGTSDTADRVTIYRNLNELKRLELIHEVDVNQYIACFHDCSHHPHVLLFCQFCQAFEELTDHRRVDSLLNEVKGLKFFRTDRVLSLRGHCRDCSGELKKAKKIKKVQ